LVVITASPIGYLLYAKIQQWSLLVVTNVSTYGSIVVPKVWPNLGGGKSQAPHESRKQAHYQGK
jgi:hypothetical protein